MIYGNMNRRAKVSLTLELDPDEFLMPVDGDPTEELTVMIEELVEHLIGTKLINLKIKCTQEQ
tara:strand:- start:492 stop:680 length:189 start_codon:yes stop_codon:yes gene_type:complete